MTESSSRTSIVGFVAWFSILVVTVVLTAFTINGMRGGKEGPGSYADLLLIPNFVLLVICGIAFLILWHMRPKSGEISDYIWKRTTIAYGVMLVILFFNSEIWGGYTLHVEVVDANHRPVPDIVVDTLEQKASLFSVFLPEDVDRTFATDATGIAQIKTNVFQSIGGLINKQFGFVGHGIENKSFRSADFKLSPVGNRKVSVGINWDKAGNRQGKNDNHYTSAPFDPAYSTLVIFLPAANGDDHFDYEYEAFGASH